MERAAPEMGRRGAHMIAGVGIDVVDHARFAALIAEPGTSFVEKTFTPMERAAAESRASRDPSQHLAARYAAKEACVKALSSALSPTPLPEALADLAEIEVVSDAEHRPQLALKGRVRALAEQAGVRTIHVSLTHDGPVAAAVVVVER
jgi:holo-[acyl-carrier protein] synthase